MADQKIDADEAAARLGVTSSRVREMCRAGTLSATKIGSRWAISALSVRSASAKAAKRRAKRPPARLDFGQALIQIRNELRLQFVPDLLRLRDYSTDVAAVTQEARERCKNLDLPVDRLHLVDAPKDELAVRPGTVLHPMDWIVYHAAVHRIAPAIDARMSTAVYSSRLNRVSNQYLTAPFAAQFAAWQRKSRRLLKKDRYKYVLVTDIVAYYEHIDIDRLHKLVKPLDHGDVSWPIIRTLLREWCPNDIRGIPQGPAASALLGNLYLTPLDDMLNGRPGVLHIRYMDDFRVFSDDRSELVRTAWALQKMARSIGLDLKTDKTAILTSAEALSLIEDPRKDSANYLMKSDPPKARRHLRKMVRTAVRKAGEPDRRSVEFGLRRLRRMGDGYLLKEVISNLDRLAVSGSVVAEFIAQFPNRPSAVAGVADYVCDANRNLWPLYEMWLLYAAGAATVPTPSSLAHHCRQRLADNGQPWWLRAAAMDVIAANATHPINEQAITDSIRTAKDAYFYRQASAILLQRGVSTKALVKAAKHLGSEDRLVRYLEGSPSPPRRWLDL